MPGERILWSGAPGRGLVLTPWDAFLIPFSILWTSFIVVWMSSVVVTGAPLFFVLWGIPFILVGLFATVGRFALDAWFRGAASYAVTDQRILIARRGPLSAFTALDLDRLPELRLTGEGRPRGNIRFGAGPSLMATGGFSAWMPSLDPTPQFTHIEQADRVFALITDASRKARGLAD